ncbi:MAG: ribonuclease J [Acidobacteria bacterium]|nr:ribonuclease J [Acidobacteriota bacterium]
MTRDFGRTPLVEVLLLGGVGEFGMNMMAVRCGPDSLLVDAGVMFPGPEHFGVDLVIPDVRSLAGELGRLSALVLTHGHEDHIGAVPYIWDLIDGPTYGTRLTLALLERKLAEHGCDTSGRLVTVEPSETVTAAGLDVEFVQVAHSIPDSVAVAIHTPAGTLLHSGDFKFDQTPLDGRPTDAHRLADLGRRGVLALFADSTNASQPGHSGSERHVEPALEEIFAGAPRRLVVTTFSSSLHRLQLLVDLADRFGRQVAFVGRGVVENAALAARLGYLRLPAGLQIAETDVAHLPPEKVLCIVTGSQGEPFSALARMAVGAHRHVRLEAGDVVVFSARAIPGNRHAIDRLMNHIARRGARVVDEPSKRVHVSGHGSEEDLKLLLSLISPRCFVPIHGEYRHLAHHARLAEQVCGESVTVLLAENSDRICFDESGGWIGEPLRAGRVLIDGTRSGQVADEVLRDRRHLAVDGVVVAVLAMNAHSGGIEQATELITRGFVLDGPTEALLDAATGRLRALAAEASVEERTDQGVMGERVRVELQRFFRKRYGRRPLVLPVILEI